MAKTVLGFDIGCGEMKIVQWNGARVQRAVHIPLPDNLVRDGRIVSYETMAQLIRETVKAERLGGREAAVVLPSTQCYLRRLTMPAMSVDQLAVNLPYEFRDFLTLTKDKYFYDYAVNFIADDAEGRPAQMDLTAATVEKSLIDDYRAMFRRAGLKLRAAMPVECAYANLLADKKGEFCIIDLGHALTRVHMFTDRRFETTRVIDIGLAAVDAAIAEDRGVDEHIARTYKQSDHEGAQTCGSAVELYHAIAADIRKAVNFYGFNNRQSNLTDAWCAGGGARIPALLDAIGQAVDLSLHDAAGLLPPVDEGVDDLTFFAAAIGAAMQ